MTVLEDKAKTSRTEKLWVENLIIPVMIMMMFVRAESEADWPLHLWDSMFQRCQHASNQIL